MKEFLIRDNKEFKLRGKITPCASPNNLYCIEFVGEEYNDKGEMRNTSTYQFFLEKEHIRTVITGLTDFQGMLT